MTGISEPLFFVRHGQTDWNAEKRYQGTTDTSLSLIGIEQAKANAALLQSQLRELGIDRDQLTLMTSPLQRARQTAAKVAADLQALNDALEKEVDALEDAYDAQEEVLREIEIKAKVADIHVPLLGLAWMPYRDSGDGRLKPAW